MTAELAAGPGAQSLFFRRMLAGLKSVLLLLLVVLLFPLGILVVGAPIVLCVRFVLELAKRL